jgi:hypothetical protein
MKMKIDRKKVNVTILKRKKEIEHIEMELGMIKSTILSIDNA